MKKEYMKPVMESEAFVANEYVAACWFIRCNRNHNIYSDVVKNKDSAEAALDSVSVKHTAFDKNDIHKGIDFDLDGHWGILENASKYYHHSTWNGFIIPCEVTAIQTNKDNHPEHPNASN